LIFAVADHFEPSYVPGGQFAPREEQLFRLERWCRDFPQGVAPYRDFDGLPWRHTYFFPAEQYDKEQLQRLSELCRAGWGEVEVQLHHGIKAPDTADNTRRILSEYVGALVSHGCLSRWEEAGPPRYAFVHGNWALANSRGGLACGVNEEVQILADTGCYADFTLPSAPNEAQISKINALYECGLPLGERAPHRRGNDLRRGRAPQIFPLMIQGPLALRLARWSGRLAPLIENSSVTAANPPTMERFRHWRNAAISVAGRPEWVFIKLHCHGMDPRDEPMFLGAPLQNFLKELTAATLANGWQLHFVTAREMVNIALAACDGREGNPGDFRDYRLRLLSPAHRA
jgi:hypothetical protein